MLINIPLQLEQSIKKYADENKINLDDFISDVLSDYLEDRELYNIGVERYQEYQNNPITYTHDEIKKELGI